MNWQNYNTSTISGTCSRLENWRKYHGITCKHELSESAVVDEFRVNEWITSGWSDTSAIEHFLPQG